MENESRGPAEGETEERHLEGDEKREQEEDEEEEELRTGHR